MPKSTKEYYKFCMVRNPWDRYVSLYEWSIQIQKRQFTKTFDEFVSRLVHKQNFDGTANKVEWTRPMLDWTLDSQGNYDCDFFGRFEDMEHSWEVISDKLGVTIPLKHVHSTKRKPYQDYYNETTYSQILEFCKKDIEYFGYTF